MKPCSVLPSRCAPEQAEGVESLASRRRRYASGRRARTRLIDGPFAEAKEMIGGFFLVDCDRWPRRRDRPRMPRRAMGDHRGAGACTMFCRKPGRHASQRLNAPAGPLSKLVRLDRRVRWPEFKGRLKPRRG